MMPKLEIVFGKARLRAVGTTANIAVATVAVCISIVALLIARTHGLI
jgi:hypothetical protein